MPSMANIQISISVRPARLALIQIGITSIANIQIGIRPKVAAAGRTRLSNIKLQYYAFNMPSRSIYMFSIATIQISIRLVVLATVQIGIRPKIAAIQTDGKLKRL